MEAKPTAKPGSHGWERGLRTSFFLVGTELNDGPFRKNGKERNIIYKSNVFDLMELV